MSREGEQLAELLTTFITKPGSRREILAEVTPTQRQALLEELLAHHDVLVAEGQRGAAHELLYLGSRVAGDDPELFYRLERKRIGWLDSQGLGGKAIEAMRNLFKTYQRSKSKALRGAELAMELGILLDRSGSKEEALKLFRSAIDRYTRMDHAYNKAAAWFNVASVLYDLGRIQASIKACRRSLKEGGSGHLDLETHVSLQLANSYESDGNEDRAEEFYRCAADGYGRLGNRRQESNILYRLGWMAVKEERFEEANLFLERALELKREHDYGTGLAYYHFHLALGYRSAGLSESASKHFRHALALASAVGNSSLSKRARFGLYRLAQGDGRPLTEYLRAKAPGGGREALQRGKNGLYSDQARDGYRTNVWRETPEAPIRDRTFLARLLEDLSKVWHSTGVKGHEKLRRQGRAVLAWQARVKGGRNLH